MGASITTVLGYFIMWVLQIRYLSKFLNYSFLAKKWVLSVLVGIFSIVPLVLIKNSIPDVILQLFVGGAVYFGFYLIGIFGLNVVNVNELKSLLRMKD